MVTPPFLFAVLFVIGIACSKVLMSISMISWLLWALVSFFTKKEKTGFMDRWVLVGKEHPWIWLVIAFFFLHVVSLFWSENLSEGINGVRVRLTFILLTLLMVFTHRWTKPQVKALISILLYTFLLLIVFNVFQYQWLLSQGKASDIRQLSYFGSHIRFGVFFSFTAILAFYNWKQKALTRWFFITYLTIVVLYTFYSQVLSAAVALCVVGIMMAYEQMKRANKVFVFWVTGSVILGGSAFFLVMVLRQPQACIAFKNPQEASSFWAKKSALALTEKDAKNQPLKRTLERYLCAKQNPMTERDIQGLSPQEVRHIEQGFTSVEQASGGVLSKLQEVQFQLHEATDPNGHSLLQRFAFWKAALTVIRNNGWFGVGIGDVKGALTQQYIDHSALTVENFKRPHNMFLTTFAAVGVLGFALLCLLFIYGFYQSISHRHTLLFCFLSVSLLTMLVEDSLETQTGISFFTFFLALFLSDCVGKGRLKFD